MIRWATPGDADALGAVFYAAVRQGPSRYTEAQRAAWLDHRPKGLQWSERLAPLQVAVAGVGGKAVGFMTIEPGGYIDLAFVRPDHQGRGLFRQLFERVEDWALHRREPRLRTHASLMAEPAFRAAGFLGIHRERVVRNGETLARAWMEKTLR